MQNFRALGAPPPPLGAPPYCKFLATRLNFILFLYIHLRTIHILFYIAKCITQIWQTFCVLSMNAWSYELFVVKEWKKFPSRASAPATKEKR